MVPIIKLIFPFFFPFRSRPLIGGAGIAGSPTESRFGTFRESREKETAFSFGTELKSDRQETNRGQHGEI